MSTTQTIKIFCCCSGLLNPFKQMIKKKVTKCTWARDQLKNIANFNAGYTLKLIQ